MRNMQKSNTLIKKVSDKTGFSEGALEDTVTTFGELQESDWVIGSSGEPVMITKAYDLHIPNRMFEIQMDNGVIIEASGSHLWYVETNEDYSHHKSRIKKASKTFRGLCDESVELLHEMAKTGYDDTIEIEIEGFLQCFAEREKPGFEDEVIRIAQSIGPVSENTYIGQDIQTDEEELIGTVYGYNGKLMARQILAMRDRRYRRRNPIIVGKVINTVELMDIYRYADIPKIEEYKAKP